MAVNYSLFILIVLHFKLIWFVFFLSLLLALVASVNPFALFRMLLPDFCSSCFQLLFFNFEPAVSWPDVGVHFLLLLLTWLCWPSFHNEIVTFALSICLKNWKIWPRSLFSFSFIFLLFTASLVSFEMKAPNGLETSSKITLTLPVVRRTWFFAFQAYRPYLPSVVSCLFGSFNSFLVLLSHLSSLFSFSLFPTLPPPHFLLLALLYFTPPDEIRSPALSAQPSFRRM